MRVWENTRQTSDPVYERLHVWTKRASWVVASLWALDLLFIALFQHRGWTGLLWLLFLPLAFFAGLFGWTAAITGYLGQQRRDRTHS